MRSAIRNEHEFMRFATCTMSSELRARILINTVKLFPSAPTSPSSSKSLDNCKESPPFDREEELTVTSVER